MPQPKMDSVIKKNLSLLDRLARMVVALVLLAMWLSGMYTSYIPLAIAGVLFFSGAVGMCGVYAIIGHSTCRTKEIDHNAAHYVAEPSPPREGDFHLPTTGRFAVRPEEDTHAQTPDKTDISRLQ